MSNRKFVRTWTIMAVAFCFALSMLFGGFAIASNVTAAVTDESTQVWSGEVADSFAGGDGTRENPFQISNGEELARLSHVTHFSSSECSTEVYYQAKYNEAEIYYVLTNDIYMGADTFAWEDINWWTGIGMWNGFHANFDGRGYSIHNIALERGFIYFLSSTGSIINTAFRNIFVSSSEQGGGLIADWVWYGGYVLNNIVELDSFVTSGFGYPEPGAFVDNNLKLTNWSHGDPSNNNHIYPSWGSGELHEIVDSLNNWVDTYNESFPRFDLLNWEYDDGFVRLVHPQQTPPIDDNGNGEIGNGYTNGESDKEYYQRGNRELFWALSGIFLLLSLSLLTAYYIWSNKQAKNKKGG